MLTPLPRLGQIMTTVAFEGLSDACRYLPCQPPKPSSPRIRMVSRSNHGKEICTQWCRGISNNNGGLLKSLPYESHEHQQQHNQPIPPIGKWSNITVSYEGQTCDVTVMPNESILAALERQSMHIRMHLTALPDMPSDCRRGNCLTCAASIVDRRSGALAVDELALSDSLDVVRSNGDGLSPAMSKLISDKGYVLTCSSFIEQKQSSASSLRLELGVQDDVWYEVYSNRFKTPETELAARTAMARVLRQSAERNVEEWARATERALRQTETK
jgi:ferredoxin